MKPRSIIIIALVPTFASCFSTARVSDGHDELPGIPFYAKTVVYRQTTEYENSWTSATLSVAIFTAKSATEKGQLLFSDTYPRVATDGPTRATLASVAARLEKKLDAHAAASIWIDFMRLPATAPMDRTPERTTNFVEPVSVIDYSRRLYVNAKTPLFGTASFEPKLASDGTLQSVKIDETSKLDEGLANLLPLKEYLTSILIPAADAKETSQALTALALAPGHETDESIGALSSFLANAPNVIIDLHLSQRPDGCKLVFAHDWQTDPTRACVDTATVTLKPLALNLIDGAYRRIDLSAKKEAEKKADDDAYSFSGSVKVPKPNDNKTE